MSITDDRLPSINGLQAFEAAARHLSFARAADELGLTPTAISHRIRNLEAELGVVLFRRGHRSVTLTDDGARIARDLSESFDCLKMSVAKLRQCGAEHLTLLAPPSFASLWLLPRLPKFRERYPDVHLTLTPTDAPDMERNGADAAIVFGCSTDQTLKTDCLFENRLVAVGSPAFLERYAVLGDAAAVTNAPLLHVTDGSVQPPMPGWQDWLRAAGVSQLGALNGIQFGACHLAIEAARHGHGLALGVSTLVVDDIQAGVLTAPFERALPIPQTYALTYPPEHATRPALRSFRSWLLGYAQKQVSLTRLNARGRAMTNGAEPALRR